MPHKGFRLPRSTGQDNSDQYMRFLEAESRSWVILEETFEPMALEGPRNDDLLWDQLRWGGEAFVTWKAPFRWIAGHGLAYQPPEFEIQARSEQ